MVILVGVYAGLVLLATEVFQWLPGTGPMSDRSRWH